MLERKDESETDVSDIENLPFIRNVDPLNTEETSTTSDTQYETALYESKMVAYYIMLLAFSEPLLNGMRYSFLVFYIQSFASDITTHTISTLTFFGMAYTAVTSLIIVSMGDKYGHDNTYIINFIVLSCGLLIESMTPSFYVFIIGYFLTKSVPSWQIAFAFIPSILPHKHTIKTLATLTTSVSILFALGPICAAAVAEYGNYRAIWIIMTIIHFLFLVISIFKLKGSINRLKEIQILVGINKSMPDDEQFPACLNIQKIQDQNDKEDDTTDTTANNKLVTSIRSYLQFWSKMPTQDLLQLLIAICMENLSWCISMETIITFYFILFMKNRYSADIMYATSLMLYLVIAFAVVNVVIPMIIKRIIPKYIWLISLSCLLQICICTLAAMRFNQEIYFWIYNGVIGILFTIISRASTMCVLELQPKEHTGKVTGLNVFIAFIFRGISIALVGAFWNHPYYSSIWYGNAVISFLILFLSVVMIITNIAFK